MPEVILKIENFNIGYNKTPLLKSFSLKLHQHEFVGIQGPSGLGKSTLLKAIAGLIPGCNDHSIKLNNQSPSEMGYPKYRQIISYLQQQPNLLDMSVKENLELPFSYKNQKGSYHQEKVIEYIHALQLEESLLNKNALELSVGQQQRVCLIRSLLIKPKVLLLDEPTSALDPSNTDSFIKLIQNYVKTQNACALLVTHDHKIYERLCEKSIDLKKYRVSHE